jgi:hypothetical protein
MGQKINLRMLDPKPAAAAPPPQVSTVEPNFEPDDDDLSAKLEREQQLQRADESHVGGWIGGAIGAIVGAVVIAIIAGTTGVWINWLSIGIGFTVALGVRRLGHGSTRQFGVIGATWAFIGCIVAYHLACCIVFAREEGESVLEFIQGVESWSTFMFDVLGPRDFAIYVAAMAAGYKFSFSNLSEQY